MAMREFVSGERLFAADLNDNFDETQLASNITSGTLDVARVPDLAASKITSGTLAAARLPTGTVLQVVQTVKTDVFSASLAQGVLSSDVTGLVPSITPTSATSKVLVIVQLSVGGSSGAINATLYRDASASAYIGDAAGSRQRVSSAGLGGATRRQGETLSIVYLDSPATTSATSYSVRLSHETGGTATTIVNQGGEDTDGTRNARGASSITLIEVAA